MPTAFLSPTTEVKKVSIPSETAPPKTGRLEDRSCFKVFFKIVS